MLPFDGSDVREHYKRYAHWLAQQAGVMGPPGRSRDDFPACGHHLCRVWRQGRGRAGNERLIPFDLIPPHHPRARVEPHAAGAGAAGHSAQPLPIHDVYHGKTSSRWRGAGRPDSSTTRSTAPDGGRERAWYLRASRASTSFARPTHQGEGEYPCWKTTCACPAA